MLSRNNKVKEHNMKFLRYALQLLIGIIFGTVTTAALIPFFASLSDESGATLALICAAFVCVVIGISPTYRRAFGRGFLFSGVALFALPLSAFILSGVAVNETVSAAADADKGYAVIGGVMAGTLVTSIAAFFGLISGAIFLVAGLVLSLGGRREVIVVQGGK